MRDRRTHLFAALLFGVGLAAAGCAARRPAYAPPKAPAMAQAQGWSTVLAGGATGKPADEAQLARWWAALGDPLLTSLEERALAGNLDLKSAEAKVRQARAQRAVAEFGLQPSVDASGSANGNRSSRRAGMGGFGQSYGASLDASWEPDFYKRIRMQIEAYGADLDAAEEDRRNILVSLTAEVALNYVDVRSSQAQIAVTQANLALQEETYKLTTARFESGLATELDAAQARATLESTRAGLPTLQASLRKSLNTISILLGTRPGVIDVELEAVKPVPVVPAEIAVGVPADLIRRRPDIRGAERRVAAQSARVGVAAAALNPTFRLSGSLGLSSLSILNLATPAALAGSLAGSIQQTVFNRGKIREQIKVQDAVFDQTVTSYEATVLSGLGDVESALSSFAQEQQRRKSLAEARAAAERALTLSRNLYAAGLKDFLTVLDAQRSLLTLDNQLAQSDANVTAGLIRLYKALGGGWS